jgi:hypothetical protein
MPMGGTQVSRKDVRLQQQGMLNFGVCILLRVLDQVQRFPSNAILFQYLFTILFKLSATCFGRTTMFSWKYIHQNLT